MKKIILMLTIGVLTSLFANAQVEPTDTDGDGYLNISTLDQLRWVSETPESWDKNFELDNDIDASDTRNWNIGDHDNDPATPDSAMGWSPIGFNYFNAFQGQFNGNGFIIDSLFIKRPRKSIVGFFGMVLNASIMDLNIKNTIIEGHSYVGSLIGKVRYSSITACNATGTVEGFYSQVGGLIGECSDYSQVYNSYFEGLVLSYGYSTGGLIGRNDNHVEIIGCSTDVRIKSLVKKETGGLIGSNLKESKIIDSYSKCEIDGEEYVGGLVGRNEDSEILYCESYGKINGRRIVGGLIGYNKSGRLSYSHSNFEIKGDSPVGGLIGLQQYSYTNNCYSFGNVDGSAGVGGIIGNNKYSTLINSYTICSVSSRNNTFGPIAGSQDQNSKTENCYWDIQKTGIQESNIGIGKTTEQMKNKNTFDKWDFDSKWKIVQSFNNGYPFFLLNSPRLIYPKNKSQYINLPVKFKWNKQFSSEKYQIQISVDSMFNEIVIDSISLNNYFTTDKLSFYTNYFWRVKSINQIDTSHWSEKWELKSKEELCSIPPIDTDGNGYKNISSKCHMFWIMENPGTWNDAFELDNNIDLSDINNWQDSFGFRTIGNIEVKFKGKFNGNGYIIENLYINRNNQNNIGFFGCIESAEIHNLTLNNVLINGNDVVGSLVGNSSNSIIFNCNVTGDLNGNDQIGGLVGTNTDSSKIVRCISDVLVNGNDVVGGICGLNTYSSIIEKSTNNRKINGSSNIGGIVGKNNNSTIINCNNSNEIFGVTNVGGICGSNSYTLINNCNNYSKVSGKVNVGGILGTNINSSVYNNFNNGKIEADSINAGGIIGMNKASYIYNCSNLAEIRSTKSAGGLIGFAKEASKVFDSFSAGKIMCEFEKGGLIGSYIDNAFVYNSFWDIETSGISISAGGEGKTTSEMHSLPTFKDAGWNFDFIWDMENGYPFINIDSTYRPKDSDGNGSLNISTLNDLRWLSESGFDLKEDYELSNDINAAETKSWNNGMGFIPISNYFNRFDGEFNGNDFTIDSLYINRPNKDNVGFLSTRTQSKVYDLKILNCKITGNNFVGALSGRSSHDTLTKNVIVSGEIEGNNFVGGISGAMGGSDRIYIENCINYCNVTGNDKVGGIVGAANYVIQNCGNYGNIIGNDYVGGILGDSQSFIYQCFSIGSIIGNNYVGGISGYSFKMQTKNCFARGKVQGNSYVGGIYGENVIEHYHSVTYGMMHDCYNAAKIIGNDSFSSLVGKGGICYSCFNDIETSGIGEEENYFDRHTIQMKTKSNYTWDFDEIWDINPAINDGYPFLIGLPFDTLGIIGPKLISPENFSTIDTLPAFFQWHEFPEALGYNIVITDDKSLKKIIIDTNTTQNEILIHDLNYNKRYYWRVRAILENDTTNWSFHWKFRIDNYRNCKYEAPTDTDSNGFLNISTLCHLEWLSMHDELWDLNFELDNDINASLTRHWNDSLGFLPIGTRNDPFSGNFNGNGYIIDSLYIYRKDEYRIGLFGSIKDAAINNIGLTNVEIYGKGGVGSLVGYQTSFSYIDQCFSTGNIYGNGAVGGLVGSLYGSHYSNCRISNSYSKSNTLGQNLIGGLVGSIQTGKISNSYSKGQVKGDSAVGGLIGYIRPNNEVINSFWDIETSGITESAGGTPKTTAEMKTKSTFTDASWDFDNIWDINPAINDGYPYLQDVTITSVQENIIEIDETAMLVYPNPASDYIVIRYPSEGSNPSEGLVLSIYNVYGQEVKTLSPALSQSERESRIDISSLPNGSYLAVIYCNNKTETVKFIINR